MSASRNKSNSTGLRILWIPGRKKHNHKGRYDSTSKYVDYSTPQKRNQPWSLGGSKGQEELIKSEIPGVSEGANCLNILPASVATGAAAAATTTTEILETKIPKSDEEQNRFAILETMEKNVTQGGKQQIEMADIEKHQKQDPDSGIESEKPNDSTPNSPTLDEVNSTQTLPIRNGKRNHLTTHDKQLQEDLNSIEHLTDSESTIPGNKKTPTGTLDMTDSSLCNIDRRPSTASRTKNKKKKKNSKKLQNDTDSYDEIEDNDKMVKCLYYALMCCECTIS